MNARPSSMSDERSIIRARLSRHFHALRHAGEAGIRQAYDFKVTAIEASASPDNVAALRRALRAEQEALLIAFRTTLAGEQQECTARQLAALNPRARLPRASAAELGNDQRSRLPIRGAVHEVTLRFRDNEARPVRHNRPRPHATVSFKR